VLARLSAIRAGRRLSSRGRMVRAVARLAAAVLAAAGLCAVMVIPAQADAVRDQEMWVLDMMQAPSAWPVTQGQGVLVAVIDSGVSPSVSDLAGSVTEGPNLSGVNTPPSDASWGVHGTWMASLIAGHGHGDGSSGIEGVAPQSRVLSIRVVTDRAIPTSGSTSRSRTPRSSGLWPRPSRSRPGVVRMSSACPLATVPPAARSG